MTTTSFKGFPKIIVVGAGPVGLYCALYLAQARYDVCVIDDGRRGAGWASGGMLGATYEALGSHIAPYEFKEFAKISQDLWREFLRGIDVLYVAGSVFVARDVTESAHLQAMANQVADFDVILNRCELPAGVVGQSAWSCLNDIALDPRHMLEVLRQYCVKRGVRFIQGTVTGVAKSRVTLGDGAEETADHIILATGQAGSALAHNVPELANISLVKGQMLAIVGSGVTLDRVIRAGRVYLVPRGDQIVVGATSTPDDPDCQTIDSSRHQALWREAVTLCPPLANGQIVESWAGLRPMTPDGLPLVGKSQMDGVLLACGTYRNGWLLAPAIAKTIESLIRRNEQSAANVQLFAPNRFSTTTQRTKCSDK